MSINSQNNTLHDGSEKMPGKAQDIRLSFPTYPLLRTKE